MHLRRSNEPRPTHERFRVLRQWDGFASGETTAQIHHLAKLRPAWVTARATAVRMPMRTPVAAAQDDIRPANDLTDCRVDGLEQVAGTRITGIAAAVRLPLNHD